jgi:serine/threonine-protein kinase
MPAADEDLSVRAQSRVGAVLCGKYRLDRLLGVGGMATVYAATHLRNANVVAVKILHRELSVDPAQHARFVREGYAANSVGHPGTVRVLDDDTAEDGSVFLVMELLDGETLDARWERSDRRLGVREVVTILVDLLDVLSAAHAKGVVHRDLKPENLFLGRADGKMRVLDFGVARLRHGSPSQTKSGSLFGTPAFMPPEQALGRTSEVDAQSDIWAVGATAFTLLSGRFVHQGRTAEEMLVLSATQPAPPLSSIVPDVPARLAEIVDRALAFDKIARWPSAHMMREALLAADKAIRSGDSHEEHEEADDDKTSLAVPPEMTLRGELAAAPPKPQQHTLEISTLRDPVSTVAGIESHSQPNSVPRRRSMVSVVIGGMGVSVASALILAVFARPTTLASSTLPTVPIAQSTSSVSALNQNAVPAPSASTSMPLPTIEPQVIDVEALPVAKPARPPAPAAATARAEIPPRPVAPSTTTRPTATKGVEPPVPAPTATTPAKRDPLAP